MWFGTKNGVRITKYYDSYEEIDILNSIIFHKCGIKMDNVLETSYTDIYFEPMVYPNEWVSGATSIWNNEELLSYYREGMEVFKEKFDNKILKTWLEKTKYFEVMVGLEIITQRLIELKK
jgi:hypothetical protein